MVIVAIRVLSLYPYNPGAMVVPIVPGIRRTRDLTGWSAELMSRDQNVSHGCRPEPKGRVAGRAPARACGATVGWRCIHHHRKAPR